MKRISIARALVLMCIAMSSVVWAANDRYYTAFISPSNVAPGGLPTNFNLIVTNNILSGPSHFLRQIIVTVPTGFTISGTVTVQAPATAPLPWKATVSGNKITVVSGSTSDASVTAGQSVTITVPALAPATGCPGGSYVWGINASQVVGGGTGNQYLPTPGASTPTVNVTCDTLTNLTLSISPDAIMTANAAAQVTFTSKLTKAADNTPLNHEPITFFLGGNPISCIGGASYTDVTGVATCSYYPQAPPNTPLTSGVYDIVATFAGDTSIVPHLGGSTAGPVKLNVNATGTGLEVTPLIVPYRSIPQPVTLTAKLTYNNGLALGGKTVSFTLGSASAGSATTDSSGVATVNATLPVLSPGELDQYIKASFAGDPVYSGANGDNSVTVGPMAATISFIQSSLTQTYTGDPLSPTVVTNPANLSYTVTGFPQTNAGAYTVSATINDPSYAGTTGNQTFTINKASVTIVITPYIVTYDTAPHSASGTATGVKGENLSGGLVITSAHTNAGTYADSWTYDGGTNYVSTSGAFSDVINKAGSSVSITGGTYVYDGQAHPATASASTQVATLTNPTAVSISYSGSCNVAPTTVAEGSSCTATGTYLGDANHAGSIVTATIVITQTGQIIRFTSIIVTATSTSGFAVSFASGTPNICSVGPALDSSNNPIPGKALVTLISGSWAQCSVLADQPGTNDVTPAPEVLGVFSTTP